jgi:hypothetical protein
MFGSESLYWTLLYSMCLAHSKAFVIMVLPGCNGLLVLGREVEHAYCSCLAMSPGICMAVDEVA